MMKRNLIFGIAVAACLAAAGYYAYDRAQGRKALIEAEEEVTAPGEFSFKKLRQKAQAMAATPYQKPAELPSGNSAGSTMTNTATSASNPRTGRGQRTS